MPFQVNNYKIILPINPDSINKVITYGKREGDIVVLKKKWEKYALITIDEALDSGYLPPKFKGRLAFFFKLYFSLNRTRDGDNYEAMCKGIIDAFVVKKMIEDDNSNCVDDDGRRLLVDAERPRVEVYLKEKIPGNDLVSIGDEHYPDGDLVPIEF
jgi:hypothetical protein